METYVALLRGINVSGHNMIKMEALKSILCDLNFTGIRTYIQSGNIIFENKTTDSTHLAKMIRDTIFRHFGFEVPVIIRTRSELEYISKNNPFLIERNENIDQLHVSFLAENPDEVHVKKTGEFQCLPDEFFMSGKEIYLFCPAGYGRTKLTNQFFENKLKTLATTRNWKTIIRLTNM